VSNETNTVLDRRIGRLGGWQGRLDSETKWGSLMVAGFLHERLSYRFMNETEFSLLGLGIRTQFQVILSYEFRLLDLLYEVVFDCLVR
jgi:uncharacterized membrane protein